MQDEIYIAAADAREYVNDGARKPFRAGDIIFVKAGVELRFENFTEDFRTRIVFWGPEGG